MEKSIVLNEMIWNIKGLFTAFEQGMLTEAQVIAATEREARRAAQQYMYTFGVSVYKD